MTTKQSQNTKDIGRITTDVAVILTKLINIQEDVGNIRACLDNTVKNDDGYKEIKMKVNRMWDDRNKMIGWMLGAGIVGGTAGGLIKSLVGAVLAR